MKVKRNTTKVETGRAFRKYLAEQLPTETDRVDFYSDVEKIQSIAKLLVALDSWRDQMGLPKAQLARRMDRPAPSVSRWLNADDPNPTLKTFLDLCSSMGVHVRIVLEPRKPDVHDRPLDVDVNMPRALGREARARSGDKTHQRFAH